MFLEKEKVDRVDKPHLGNIVVLLVPEQGPPYESGPTRGFFLLTGRLFLFRHQAVAFCEAPSVCVLVVTDNQ